MLRSSDTPVALWPGLTNTLFWSWCVLRPREQERILPSIRRVSGHVTPWEYTRIRQKRLFKWKKSNLGTLTWQFLEPVFILETCVLNQELRKIHFLVSLYKQGPLSLRSFWTRTSDLIRAGVSNFTKGHTGKMRLTSRARQVEFIDMVFNRKSKIF